MLRVPRVSTFTRGWGLFALYLCAMGAIGATAVQTAYAVSEGIWHAAVASAADKQRDLSRVEKFYAARAASWRKPRLPEPAPVLALERPDIHPAALAAAMDRTELASASEHPERHAAAVGLADHHRSEELDVASWRTRTIAVAGLTCSVDGCNDATLAYDDGGVAEPSATANADQVAYTISDEAAAEAANVTMEQAKLEKARLAQARQKRKALQDENAPFAVKFFEYQPGDRGLRVAETPGDIIRASLLRGTI